MREEVPNAMWVSELVGKAVFPHHEREANGRMGRESHWESIVVSRDMRHTPDVRKM